MPIFYLPGFAFPWRLWSSLPLLVREQPSWFNQNRRNSQVWTKRSLGRKACRKEGGAAPSSSLRITSSLVDSVTPPRFKLQLKKLCKLYQFGLHLATNNKSKQAYKQTQRFKQVGVIDIHIYSARNQELESRTHWVSRPLRLYVLLFLPVVSSSEYI